MIRLSARCVSRAWLAVALAASDDEARPVLFRTIRVEEYSTGVRLIATDSYMLAWCWVPAWAELEDPGWPAGAFTAAAGLDEVPVASVTVRDNELRVRDLMRHVKAATSQKDALDFPVEIELAAKISNDAQPSLLPEWEQPAARFELPTRERVLAALVELEWPDWRKIAFGAVAGEIGAVRRVLSAHNLERVARMASICGGGSLTFDMTDGGAPSVLWQITGQPRLVHVPHGVMAVERNGDEVDGRDGASDAVDDAVAGSGTSPKAEPATAKPSTTGGVATLTEARRARHKVAGNSKPKAKK